MARHAEQLYLFAEGTQHMNHDRGAHMRRDARGHRLISRLDAYEHFAVPTALLDPVIGRLGPAVPRRRPGHLLYVWHEAGADLVIFVLEQEGEGPIVLSILVARQAPIHNHVRPPGTLLGQL